MLHIAQVHHLVGQQLQRPALSPIRSLATGQMNQLGFSLAIQRAPFGTFPWKASGKSHFQVLLHKALFDANHRAATDGEDLGNLPIGGTRFALTLITHQQHPGDQIVLGWSAAHMEHRLQPSALLLAQFHEIAVVRGSHPRIPSLAVSILAYVDSSSLASVRPACAFGSPIGLVE